MTTDKRLFRRHFCKAVGCQCLSGGGACLDEKVLAAKGLECWFIQSLEAVAEAARLFNRDEWRAVQDARIAEMDRREAARRGECEHKVTRSEVGTRKVFCLDCEEELPGLVLCDREIPTGGKGEQ